MYFLLSLFEIAGRLHKEIDMNVFQDHCYLYLIGELAQYEKYFAARNFRTMNKFNSHAKKLLFV